MSAETDLISPRRARRSARHMVIFRSLSQLLTALSLFLLLRWLTEEQYGVYSLFQACLPLVSALASLGIGNTLQRFLPELIRRRDFSLVRRFMRLSLWLRGLSVLLLMAVAGAFLDPMLVHFKLTAYRELIWPFVVLVFFYFQARVLRMALVSFLRHDMAFIAQILLAIVKCAGYATGLALGWDLLAVFWVDALSYLVLMTAFFAGYRKVTRQLAGGATRFDPDEARRMRRYAFFYMFNDATGLPLGRAMDQLLIGLFLQPVHVAAYAFAATLNKLLARVSPIRYFLEIIRTVLFADGAEAPRDLTRRRFVLLSKLSLLTSIPWLFIVWGLYPALIDVLLEGKYRQAEWVVAAMMGLGVINAVQLQIILVAQLRERSGAIFLSKIFSVYNLALNVWLIPVFGVYGALLATASAVALQSLFVWGYIRQDAPLHRLAGFTGLSVGYWGLFALGLRAGLVEQAVPGWGVIGAGGLLTLVAFWCYVRLPLFSAAEASLMHRALGRRGSHRFVRYGLLPRRFFGEVA